MNRRTKSHNRRIISSIIRKIRHYNPSNNVAYLVLYAFLYKYLSDNLKNYLLKLNDADETDIRHFYENLDQKASIREWALNDLGYFIDSYDAYIDQVVRGKYDEFFISGFLKALRYNISFSEDNPAKNYLNMIFESIENNFRYYRVNYNDDMLLLNDLIYSILMLDISEEEFTYQQAYNQVAYSRLIKISPTPEYISNILTRIISSQKKDALNAYDPFLRDSSALINISNETNVANIYGKEGSNLHYIYSIINAFIEGFDFRNIFFFNENALESMGIDETSFDVIVSKVPNRFRDGSKYRRQNLEAPNIRTNTDFKDKFLSNFDLDLLNDDEEIIKALNVIEEKMAKMERSSEFQFFGEYETLLDSDFLFIINMVNVLKDDGIMAISVSQNFLFKKSLTTLRKFLTYEKNYIDAIISLPEELSRSIRPEVIIVFKKNKDIDNIVFVDLSKNYGVATSKNMVSGVVRRNLILDNDTLNRIVDVYSNRKTVNKFSEVVNLEELEGNEFNLTVSRYVDTYEGEYIKLEDLIDEKEEIENNIKVLNKKIDNLMENLDINLNNKK